MIWSHTPVIRVVDSTKTLSKGVLMLTGKITSSARPISSRKLTITRRRGQALVVALSKELTITRSSTLRRATIPSERS
jgi:hypothetical protein